MFSLLLWLVFAYLIIGIIFGQNTLNELFILVHKHENNIKLTEKQAKVVDVYLRITGISHRNVYITYHMFVFTFFWFLIFWKSLIFTVKKK